jgi:cysteine desulfurase
MSAIYLDNAASTALLPEAWEAMRPWALRSGNASSSHAFGRAARQGLEDARRRVADCLDAEPDEVVFTSGATEANNLALFGLAGESSGTVLASPIEHPCITEPIQKLVARGWMLAVLPVDHNGIVALPPASWANNLRLATLMLANHETGAIQPVRELRNILPPKVALHCDAAAAAGKMPVSFGRLGVSTLTISGHKFHGPQGIGALVVKKGTRLDSMFQGGHQQQGKRPGTEAVSLAIGLAVALEAACRNFEEHNNHVRQLRRTMLKILVDQAAPVIVNGPEEGLPFPGINADALMMSLDLTGVASSTGSACSSGSLLPSPVLRAMGVPAEDLRAAMRFSFNGYQTLREVVEASERIVNTVNRLRRNSGDAV